jgi:hypothetical protein
MSCLLALEVLCAQYGDDVPYKNGLDRGFAYRGQLVPFLNYQKGIYRAAVQTGPGKTITVLRSAQARPYKERLAMRFDRFVELSS